MLFVVNIPKQDLYEEYNADDIDHCIEKVVENVRHCLDDDDVVYIDKTKYRFDEDALTLLESSDDW